jgi:hypothetical protein
MNTEGIGDWVEREFGARDERLFDLDLRDGRIDRLEEEHACEYESARSEMETLNAQFEKTLQAATDTEEHERDQYKQRAKNIKRKYQIRADERDKHGRRLTATLVVRSFVTVDEQDPDVIRKRIVSEVNESTVEKQSTKEYLAAVADALDIDGHYFPEWVVDSETPSGPIGFPKDVSSNPVQLDSIDSEEPSSPEIDWDLNEL